MNRVYKCTIQTYKDSKTNTWPAYQLLFENLWLNAKDAYQAHHNGFVGTFNYTLKKLPKIEKPDWEGSAAFCENYFDWLSRKLSEKGAVSFPQVEEKLRELLGI